MRWNDLTARPVTPIILDGIVVDIHVHIPSREMAGILEQRDRHFQEVDRGATAIVPGKTKVKKSPRSSAATYIERESSPANMCFCSDMRPKSPTRPKPFAGISPFLDGSSRYLDSDITHHCLPGMSTWAKRTLVSV